MRYLSVCSGIEAATVAWEPLGWTPWAFAEVDKFPSAHLAHHYPAVPNLGDITRFKEWPDAAIDVLVGGTPCQSFSLAGLRKGLADPRGNLTLTYLAIAARYRPRWLVWENVPGVLSDDGGKTFGTFLGGLAELGYGFAYRVLDAQFFGLAQRRNRVFVVGYLGDWRPPAAVLFERASLSGNPAPSRKARQDLAGTIGGSSQSGGFRTTDLDNNGAFVVERADPIPILEAGARPGTSQSDPRAGMGIGAEGDPMFTLQAGKQHGIAQPIAFSCTDHGQDARAGLAPTLRAMGHAESHANGGAQVAIAFHTQQDPIHRVEGSLPLEAKSPAQAVAYGNNRTQGSVDVAGGIRAKGGTGHGDFESETFVAQPFTFESRYARNGRGAPDEVVGALKAEAGSDGRGDAAPLVAETEMSVRRLTPKEWERLQGFPDDHTLVPYRGKPAADGPRYKAIGNSFPVPVLRWIGRRIQMVEEIP